MSENSSSSDAPVRRPRHIKRLLKRAKTEKTPRNWNRLVLLPLWVTAAFIASNLLVVAALWILSFFHISIESLFRPAILQTAIATIIYILTIAIVIGVPYIWNRRTTVAQLGLTRLPSWTDIGLAPVAFILYTLIATLPLSFITSSIPGFPSDQVQDVGFKALGSRSDNILAFITLVIIAPLAEETLFRGYLYGKLKGNVPAVWAAIATSLLFGIAHLQWNVSIDVFFLSLILCGLRSLTGSIWAGVLVHVIKNALAYYLLFVNPLVGG